MARQFITGDVELEKTLAKLADKAADRVARSAIGAGLTVMKGAIKKAAPVGKTGMLKKSIGSRFQRASHGKPVVAKAGVNVGKKKKKEVNTKRAPHAHLVALGTKARTRKRLGGKYAYIQDPSPAQLSTGSVTANEFVKFAASSARGRMAAKMKERAAKTLAKEAAKARR